MFLANWLVLGASVRAAKPVSGMFLANRRVLLGWLGKSAAGPNISLLTIAAAHSGLIGGPDVSCHSKYDMFQNTNFNSASFSKM